MLYLAEGGPDSVISHEQLAALIRAILSQLAPARRVLVLPPDITRLHSEAGFITHVLYDVLGAKLTDILPTTGTHYSLSVPERTMMYPGIPETLFRRHDWRKDTVNLGQLPADFVKEATSGAIAISLPVDINKIIIGKEYDLIFSVGQVLPHEVVGMANYNKNVLIGAGGFQTINASHFISAVYGIEKILGKKDNPVRRLINRACQDFLNNLPIIYILTVVEMQADGTSVLRGLYIGDDDECFEKAAALSLAVNVTFIDKPVNKMIALLPPLEYKSAWLGNKSIYRTRMAIADGGELVVLAPGVSTFGEDAEIDALIRRYGYHGTDATLQKVEARNDLAKNLCAAAHLIHGSSEGRFKITYCPGKLSEKEIRDAGFGYGDLEKTASAYNVDTLSQGFNRTRDGEEIYFINNPGLGLWTTRAKYEIEQQG